LIVASHPLPIFACASASAALLAVAAAASAWASMFASRVGGANRKVLVAPEFLDRNILLRDDRDARVVRGLQLRGLRRKSRHLCARLVALMNQNHSINDRAGDKRDND
jgi:hypothetical protein